MTTEDTTTKIKAAPWERANGGWRRLDAAIPTQVRACVTPEGNRFVWVAFDPTLARPSEEGTTFSLYSAFTMADRALTAYGVQHDGVISRSDRGDAAENSAQLSAYTDNHDPSEDLDLLRR